MVEERTKEQLKTVVVTIPTNFRRKERTAIKNACHISGFSAIHFLPATFAVALTYEFLGLSTISKTGCVGDTILVVIFGGRTLEILVLRLSDQGWMIQNSEVSEFFGGSTFDKCMAAHFSMEIQRKFGIDLSGNYGAMRRLEIGCERAKRKLSEFNKADIQIDSLAGEFDFCETVSKVHIYSPSMGIIIYAFGLFRNGLKKFARICFVNVKENYREYCKETKIRR